MRNYRSSPQIVIAANRLLAGTPSQGVELKAQQEAGPQVTYAGSSDEVAEATRVAERIVALRSRGHALDQVAVLFRINAQSEAYEEALGDRSIPYLVRGAGRFFDRAEVREAVTRLRGAARGSAEPEPLLESVRGILGGMGWTPDPPVGRGQTRDRWESWQALVAQAEGHLTTHPEADLGAFVDDLDRRAAEQHAPTAERRHPGDVPRRQGTGVGRRVPGRDPGRHPADHLRRHPGGGRGGAPAALRRHDPRPPRARPLVGAGAQPRAGAAAQALAVPRAAAARDACRAPAAARARARTCVECGDR